MSIRDEIKAKLQENRLFRLRPIIEGDPEERMVLMSHEINELVSGPWPAPDFGRPKLHRQLDQGAPFWRHAPWTYFLVLRKRMCW